MASDETVVAEVAGEPADTFDAHDEAMLDMVAMEMAAPDTDAAYDPTIEELQHPDMQVAEAQALASLDGTVSESVAAYEIEVTFPDSRDTADEPAAATALPVVTPLQSVPEPVAVPELAIEPETAKPELELPPSLGSSLLANGIVPRPRASRPDPLAPIRRMSQTEKIAFFS